MISVQGIDIMFWVNKAVKNGDQECSFQSPRGGIQLALHIQLQLEVVIFIVDQERQERCIPSPSW